MVIYIDKNILKIVRTSSDNPDFKELVKLLDAELAERDGADHPFYAQYNKIDKIKFAVVAYENGKPVSCGAIKEYSNETMEIKRMYTLPDSRGRGIAAKVLSAWKTGRKSYHSKGAYWKQGRNNLKQLLFIRRMVINLFQTTGSMPKWKIVYALRKNYKV